MEFHARASQAAANRVTFACTGSQTRSEPSRYAAYRTYPSVNPTRGLYQTASYLPRPRTRIASPPATLDRDAIP